MYVERACADDVMRPRIGFATMFATRGRHATSACELSFGLHALFRRLSMYVCLKRTYIHAWGSRTGIHAWGSQTYIYTHTCIDVSYIHTYIHT